MKIFYAVQATGNGHISRATEIIPFLKKYGTVDVFLSGNNHSLKNDLPVAYKSKGLSLYYDREGSVDLWKTFKSIQLKKMWNEAKHLPIEKYDLIINDFECITSLSCRLKNIPSIHFGHQASFVSNKVPRPHKRELTGEWVLKHYASCTQNIGLHLKSYDHNIFPPIIKSSIISAEPKDNGHITVYLNHYSDEVIIKYLSNIKDYNFEVFSKEATSSSVIGRIKLLPINQEMFNQSLIHCHGIITGAGFETPAEALYLGKKVMVIPLQGQYEQQCNAKALEEFNAMCLPKLDNDFSEKFKKWINQFEPIKLNLSHSTEEIIRTVIHKAPAYSIPSNTIPNLPSPLEMAI